MPVGTPPDTAPVAWHREDPEPEAAGPPGREGSTPPPAASDPPPSLPLRAVLEENDSDDAALDRELGTTRLESGRPAEVMLAAGSRGLRDPDWVRRAPSGSRSALGLLWRMALVLLLVALLLQIFVMQAGPLAAAWPPARPYIALAWQQLGREPPWQRDLDRLRVLQSDVRDHPERPGSLLVTVRLVNEALFEQPFPAIELTLGDATGGLVGRRRFEPATYLGADWLEPAFMPVGRSVDVVLELAGNHGQAAAFTIELR
jgi:hypothetical protein